jgi:hypothetical protein
MLWTVGQGRAKRYYLNVQGRAHGAVDDGFDDAEGTQ